MAQFLNDETLLVRAVSGCEHSFSAIYRKYQGVVYRYAVQMCGSESAAEDVTQEVFLAVLSGRNRYDASRGAALPYLMGMARNQVYTWLRKRKPWVSLEDEGDTVMDAAGEPAQGSGEREDQLERVKRALASLPPLYREVVVLCELEEMDYAQAAQALGVAIGTVRSRLHRARALLMAKCGVDKCGVERRCPA